MKKTQRELEELIDQELHELGPGEVMRVPLQMPLPPLSVERFAARTRVGIFVFASRKFRIRVTTPSIYGTATPGFRTDGEPSWALPRLSKRRLAVSEPWIASDAAGMCIGTPHSFANGFD